MAKTYDQIIGEMTADVEATVGDVDTRQGTVLREVLLGPVAVQLEGAYARTDQVESNMSIVNPEAATAEALDAIAANFGISRFGGSPASGTVRFVRYQVPPSPISIPLGTLLYTSSTADSLSFRTINSATLSASSSQDPVSGAYYVEASVLCLVNGITGNVSAGTVSVFSIPGVDEIYNPSDLSGGRAEQTNSELAELIRAKAQGNLGTRGGYEALVRSNFSVLDTNVIGPTDPEMRRQDAGAVDVILLNDDTVQSEEGLPVATTTVIPAYLPLISVVEILGVDILDVQKTLVLGTDYSVTVDNFSQYARSWKELSHVDINITSFTPKPNSILTFRYTNSQIARVVQAFLENDANWIIGSDPLAKLSRRVDSDVTANIRIFPGYDPTTTAANVSDAIKAHFDAQLLDGDVQSSDVITVIGSIAGVDFVDLSTFLMIDSRTGNPTSDVVIGRDEHARSGAITVGII